MEIDFFLPFLWNGCKVSYILDWFLHDDGGSDRPTVCMRMSSERISIWPFIILNKLCVFLIMKPRAQVDLALYYME